ncbi:hypothetical protein [Borreliella valaisiana]|uniref:hypothetical protein n=1 Tax=Borreliella valaisiana TaxID=62088 RepID=UPI003B2142D7
MYLHSAAKVDVDFHSGGPLFLDSIDSALHDLYKDDLLESTKFFNYATVENIRVKNDMASKPPDPIYYTKRTYNENGMLNEHKFFTIGLLRIPSPHVGNLGQLEIVVRTHDFAPQEFLVYRVNHHERDDHDLRRRRYHTFSVK